MAALPIPVVLQLDMDRAQRNTVLLLLCLGFLVSVVGTVRTYYVYTLFNSNDLTWYAGPHWICSEVEICTAMVCYTQYHGKEMLMSCQGLCVRTSSSLLHRSHILARESRRSYEKTFDATPKETQQQREQQRLLQ